MSDSNAVEAAKCDYCGASIGFYGCPRHGTDCYNEFDDNTWERIDDAIERVLSAYWPMNNAITLERVVAAVSAEVATALRKGSND